MSEAATAEPITAPPATPVGSQPPATTRTNGTIAPAGKAQLSPREERRNAAETVAAAAAAFLAMPAAWNAIHAAAMLGEHPGDANAAGVMLELVGTGDAGTRAAATLDALDASVQAWQALSTA